MTTSATISPTAPPGANPPFINIDLSPEQWAKLRQHSCFVAPDVNRLKAVFRRRAQAEAARRQEVIVTVKAKAMAACAGAGGGSTVTCSTAHEAHSPAPTVGSSDDDGDGDGDPAPAPALPSRTTNPPKLRDNIPPELRALPNWVVRSHPGKIPFDPRTGRPAKADDPTTWGAFDQAVAALGHLRCGDAGLANGVGFEFAAPFCGIDLDDCVDEQGNLTEEAKRIIALLDSYTEWSPSGKGVHILVLAKLPGGHNKKIFSDRGAAGMKMIELYDRERYFTITGKILPGLCVVQERQAEVDALFASLWPTEAEGPGSNSGGPGSNDDEPGFHETDDELLAKIRKSKGADKFNKLMTGDLSLNHGDESSADFSLLCILAWWTRKDADAMERLFGLSELAKREKWQKRPDYRAHSIARAIQKTATTRGRGHPRLNVNLLPFMANDLGNAERMLALFGDDMRYCYLMKKWLIWDERRWVVDEGGAAEQLAKEALREYFRQASEAALADPGNGNTEALRKHARSSLNNHPLSSVLAVARSMREINHGT
jgi:putative DNA primase/helicase